MANLTECSTFDAGIYHIETSDSVIGGPTGIANKPGKGLANRTRYLKDHLDIVETKVTTLETANDDKETRVTDIENTKIHLIGTNFSKGSISLSTGSPMVASSDNVGKLHIVNVNSLNTIVSLPSLADVTAGSIFPFIIISTNPVYELAKVTFSKIGSDIIVGNPNDFCVGDSLDFVCMAGGFWYIIPKCKKSNGAEAGTLGFHTKSTPPIGYLVADGSAVSRSTYSRLFAMIGTTYGVGNGSTTFNLPDNRGVFLRGWDNGRGLDISRILGSYQVDAFKDHTHSILSPEYKNDTDRGGLSSEYSIDAAVTGVTGLVSSPNGGATETRPKNNAYLPIIKY